jgi:amino acid adenylation domain-containing protein
MGDRALTYGQLDELSDRLAGLLVTAGCRPGDRIAMAVPKSPEAVVAMLASSKARCVYVPIDTASPAARVAKIIRACEPRALLVAEATLELAGELVREGATPAGMLTGCLDAAEAVSSPLALSFGRCDWEAHDPGPLPTGASSTDPVHILFTSGSTGTPKGVVITHANVSTFIEWAVPYFGTGPSDRISGHPPLHFDLSTFDVYGTFVAGAELHLVPPGMNVSAHELADFIRRSELTQWFSVPSAMSYLARFDAIAHGDFPSLRRVLWCGEVLPTAVLIHWMHRIPHARFTNLYGPTEATIASSYHTVTHCPASPADSIPIGTACPGEEVLVLDADLRPVPPGSIGDLYIAGLGLSPGYWQDEAKTRDAFISDPRHPGSGRRIYRTGDLARMDEGGLVWFVGRRDTQIKSRGYRIELGEIENALNAVPGLKECAVVGVETGGFEGIAICCAYATGKEVVRPATVRKHLATLVPQYMIPSHWLALEVLPKNVNGKIDRRSLKELFSSRVGPRTHAASGSRLSGPAEAGR